MGAGDNQGKDPKGRKEPDLINQIEGLAFPKRADKRRSVYLGEQVSCLVRYDQFESRADIIDLSSRGLAMVETHDGARFPCVAGQKVWLDFDRGLEHPFTVEGVVSNISQARFAKRDLKRIGIQFAIEIAANRDAFLQALGERVIACRSPIRPQASCHDPFFFNELMLFQVEAFSAHGVELAVSARCKSLLPHQPLELDIFIPGRNRFVVPVSISPVQLRNQGNRNRIFVKYRGTPPQAYHEALSEYLVMFGDDVTPQRLREEGFVVGILGHAFDISYASLSDDILTKEHLETSVLALPIMSQGQLLAMSPYARTLRCKIGPHLVAVMGLVFVEGDAERSSLQAGGHNIPAAILAARHLELSDFYISPKAVLADVLLPLLQNIVRIAVQARAKHVLMECNGQIRPILQKMGFRDLDSPSERSNGRGETVRLFLMELPVTTALLNKDQFLPETVWRRVYQDLFQFFKDQSAKKKQTPGSPINGQKQQG